MWLKETKLRDVARKAYGRTMYGSKPQRSRRERDGALLEAGSLVIEPTRWQVEHMRN
jgi:hypothetical protein